MRQFAILIIAIVFCVGFSTVSAVAQSGKKKSSSVVAKGANLSDNVILRVGSESITYGELERAFQKNMTRRSTRLADIPRDSVREFVELFGKYRLKVLDAVDRGIHNDSAVRADIANNRRLLSETYYFDKKIVEPAVSSLIERRKREVQVGIMVFLFDRTDTTRAYAKAKKCLNLLMGGADFAKLARDSSEDTETAKKGGTLPFFTSAKVLRPVEDAAYKGKPGQTYPELVRTRVGYFIVKVLDNLPRVKVRISHILFSTATGPLDSLSARRKADSVLALLRKGESFERLAKETSSDLVTNGRGGYLGSYYTRSEGLEATKDMLLPEYERAVYALKDGEISNIVFTDFGAHIIRRDSTLIPEVDKEKESVKKDYKRLYFQSDKEKHLDSVRRAMGHQWNNINLASLLRSLDTTKSATDTVALKNVGTALRAMPLYYTPGKNFTVGDLIDSVRKRRDIRATMLNTVGLRNALYKMTDQRIIDVVTANLEKDYPDFSALMKEFRDGIMLFKVEEMEVWSKLKFDSTEARKYWEERKVNYKTDLLYDLSEIYLMSDTLGKSLLGRLKSGESFSALAQEYTERKSLKDKKGAYGPVSTKTNRLAMKIKEDYNPVKPGEIYGPLPFEKGFVLVRLNEIQQPRTKSFQEAIPDFAPGFQDMTQKRLTEQWLAKVKNKFALKIEQKTFDKIFVKK